YFGATLAALAVGTAPPEYRSRPEIQGKLALLREYLSRELAVQTLANRLMVLWASTKLPELLTRVQQRAITEEALSKQRADGGFSLWTFSGESKPWTRIESDGYATGLVGVVLQELEAGTLGDRAQLQLALSWLRGNQDRIEGRWFASSLNKPRNPYSDVGRFMSDAATAQAVLALQRATQDGAPD